MPKHRLYQAVNNIIRYWQQEGDTASSRELWHDAILHVRWRIEKGWQG